MSKDYVVVLVDGHCTLCKGWTHWAIQRDGSDRLRFASQQGRRGHAILQEAHVEEDSSVIVVSDEQVFTRSRAVLEVLRVLSWPWPLLYAGIVIPWFLRDWAYDFVASHRYDWFGREEENFCDVGGSGLQDKLLE